MDPMSAPSGDDPQSQVSALGQQIVQAASKLSPDDLSVLMRGISPEALEVMEKIPDLGPFADFVENQGGKSDPDDQSGMPGKRPGVAIVIGVGRPRDPRADVAQAAAQHGLK